MTFFLATKSVPEVKKFTTLKPNPIITCKVPTAPVQHVSPVRAFIPNLISETQIPSSPIQHVSTVLQFSSICERFLTILITLIYVTPILIAETRISSPPIQKVSTSCPMKPQFSGSCINKSRHKLRPKVRLVGTGWKRVKEQKTNLHMKESSRRSRCSMKSLSWKKSVHISYRRSSSKESNPKPLLSAESTLASWKYRKKKSAFDKGSALREKASWK